LLLNFVHYLFRHGGVARRSGCAGKSAVDHNRMVCPIHAQEAHVLELASRPSHTFNPLSSHFYQIVMAPPGFADDYNPVALAGYNHPVWQAWLRLAIVDRHVHKPFDPA
jgi:hypothetical protein